MTQLLSDDQIATLSDKLRIINDFIELEMAVACDGQGHTAPNLAYTKPQFGSRTPYPLGLNELLDDLHNELTTTIRHLQEYDPRNRYTGGNYPTAMAEWLNRKRHAIANLPDADEVYDGLVGVINRCARAVNVGVEREFSQALYEEANRLWYTADQLEKLAPQLGAQARGVTKNRVKLLARSHGLAAHVDRDSGVARYRLGDVLSLHKLAPRRNRVKAS